MVTSRGSSSSGLDKAVIIVLSRDLAVGSIASVSHQNPFGNNFQSRLSGKGMKMSKRKCSFTELIVSISFCSSEPAGIGLKLIDPCLRSGRYCIILKEIICCFYTLNGQKNGLNLHSWDGIKEQLAFGIFYSQDTTTTTTTIYIIYAPLFL